VLCIIGAKQHPVSSFWHTVAKDDAVALDALRFETSHSAFGDRVGIAKEFYDNRTRIGSDTAKARSQKTPKSI
jgi:hypothetical protein